MSLIDRLRNEQRPLLVWGHGLGDFCNFLPIYHEIIKRTGKRVSLGVQSKRQFHLIYPNVILTDKLNSIAGFSYIYNVKYKEDNNDLTKAENCAINEFGMENFVWEPHQFKNDVDNNNKRVGVNFFGITGSNKESKFCSLKTAYRIWYEIKAAGYIPFELYQRVGFINDYYRDGNVPDDFPLADKTNSLRFKEPNLKLLHEEIKKCCRVISTDSGILYLALSTIGKDNVIGLENQKKISRYLPIEIEKVDVADYKKKSVFNLLTKGGNDET